MLKSMTGGSYVDGLGPLRQALTGKGRVSTYDGIDQSPSISPLVRLSTMTRSSLVFTSGGRLIRSRPQANPAMVGRPDGSEEHKRGSATATPA